MATSALFPLITIIKPILQGIKKRKSSEENFKFMNYEIREMLPEDSVAVLKIFEEGIFGGNATFDKEIPTWENWDKNHFSVCRFVVEDENHQVIAWAAFTLQVRLKEKVWEKFCSKN